MSQDASLTIATFNVNGIRTRLPHLLEWLRREQPHIACLQELKSADQGFPRSDIEAAGYHVRWVGQTSWNGVAVLTRGAPSKEIRRELPGDPSDSHARYLEVEAFGVIVACLYLPNGNPQPGPKFDYKLKWFDRFIRHARKLHALDKPVILAGDFNVVPTDEDIYNPRSWRKDALLQPESRERYARLLDMGWVDALRAVHGDARIYTFWDYFRQHWERNAGLRIDHLLLNPVIAPFLRDAGVDRWVRDQHKPSDHAPTWIRLGLPVDEAGAAEPSRKSRTSARRTSTGTTTAGKTSASSSAAKKSTAKKSTANKSFAKKTTAKKSAAKKSTAKKSTAKKSIAKKSIAKKSARSRRTT